MSLERIYKLLSGKTIENINAKLINQLINNYDEDKVFYCLKKIYNIDIIFNDEKQIENITNNIARNDIEFRELVKRRFNNCIICQNNECNIDCCNVCHIWNYSFCDDNSKYDINNGLLLCANTHSYFDKHLIKFKIIDYNNAMVSIQIDDKLKHCKIYKYNNSIITLFNENLKYLEKRYSC